MYQYSMHLIFFETRKGDRKNLITAFKTQGIYMCTYKMMQYFEIYLEFSFW